MTDNQKTPTSESQKRAIKKYYDRNREQIIEYMKNYYQTHKDAARVSRRINAQRQRERDGFITCECGSEIRKHTLYTHVSTKKHIAYKKSHIENFI